MIHRVGMADARIAREGDALRTLGLGSCVGVALYDPVARVAGLAHVMLPSSAGAKESSPAKYADTAIPYLVRLMTDAGAGLGRITAKLAGGAQMFAMTRPGVEFVRVGPRNVEAVQAALELLSVPVLASDVGGNYGRTVEIDAATGRYLIRTAQFGQCYI